MSHTNPGYVQPPKIKEGLNGASSTVFIEIKKIRPFKEQIRKHFDRTEIENLGEGIKARGQEYPVTVRPLPSPEDGVEYEIIDGERRYRASKEAGKTHLECIVRYPKDFLDHFIMSITGNGNRIPTSVVEDMKAMHVLQQKGVPIKEIAIHFGKKEHSVYAYLRLTKLHPEVLRLMGPDIPEEKRITFSTASLLIPLPQNEQESLATLISVAGMSFQSSQNLVKNALSSRGILQKGVGRRRNEFKLELRRFLRIHGSLELLINQPESRLRSTFGGKQPSEIDEFISTLTRISTGLTKVAEIVKKHKCN